MYGIALYCKDTHGVMWWWELSDSNTTPGLTTILCSALENGNMYEIALYCKGTRVVVMVVVVIF